MKMMKRVLAFALMLCILGSFLVIPDVAQAADYKGKTQRFRIRLSDGYGATDVWVKMTATSTDGKKGTIVFEKNLITSNFAKTPSGRIPSGAKYNYTIKSLKEGGKIEMTFATSGANLATYPDSKFYNLSGVIHIDKSKGCKIANIWKIDTMRYYTNLIPKKMYLYLRND